MEANASNWLALWIARTTATLELAQAARHGTLTEIAAASERTLHAAIEAMREGTTALPAVLLRTRLDLSPTEERILWLLLATELSVNVREMTSLLAGSSQPTVAMLLDTIYGSSTSATGWSELAPTAPL